RQLGLKISPTQLLEHPTIAALAALPELSEPTTEPEEEVTTNPPTRGLPPPDDFDIAPQRGTATQSTQSVGSRVTPPPPVLGSRPSAVREIGADALPTPGLSDAPVTTRNSRQSAMPIVTTDADQVPPPARTRGGSTVTFQIGEGGAVRPGTTPEQAAAMAEAMQIFRQRAEAESARQAETNVGEPLHPFPGVREGGVVMIGELPPAGLPEDKGLRERPDARNRALQRGAVSDAQVERALRLARVSASQGDFDEARDQFDMVLAARPDSVEALMGLGDIENRESKLERSIAKYYAAQVREPTSAIIATKLAEVYVGTNDLSRARREAERAVAADARSALALSWLATVEMLEGNREASSARFQKAQQLEPRVAELRFKNIAWMLESDQARRATIEAVSVLSMQPEHRGALFAAGEAYADQDNRERAAAYFRRYLEVDPNGEQAAEARQRLRELGMAGRVR
ncbi:MAG: tetratricopeptide repeat protein, partial [Opitutaceae bacterium]